MKVENQKKAAECYTDLLELMRLVDGITVTGGTIICEQENPLTLNTSLTSKDETRTLTYRADTYCCFVCGRVRKCAYSAGG